MANRCPTVRHAMRIIFTVKDDLGEFEFDATESTDTEILKGLAHIIDNSEDRIRSNDATRYAIFALLTNYFGLEQTRDGRGDRLTSALFDGVYEY